VETTEPEDPLEESLFPMHLDVNERVDLQSVSSPVLTFWLKRVSLSVARGPQRELMLDGYCEQRGTRKRCPRMTWLHLTDEEGKAPKGTGTYETNIGISPDYTSTASVRAPARRFLITVGDPKNPDVRWSFDVTAKKFEVAR
jgi:hypothetical protein